MTPQQMQLIAAHLNTTIDQIDYIRQQFTFKGGQVMLARVFGKSPRFVSNKVIMSEIKAIYLSEVFPGELTLDSQFNPKLASQYDLIKRSSNSFLRFHFKPGDLVQVEEGICMLDKIFMPMKPGYHEQNPEDAQRLAATAKMKASEWVVNKAIEDLENILAHPPKHRNQAEELANKAIIEVATKGLAINDKTSPKTLVDRAKQLINEWDNPSSTTAELMTQEKFDAIEQVEADLFEIIECIPISGSKNQIPWAESIRQDVIKLVAIALNNSKKDERDLAPLLSQPPYTWAKTWIDSRFNKQLLADAIAEGRKVKV